MLYADEKPSRFNMQALEVDEDEFRDLVHHLRGVWDGIGADLLQATEEGNPDWDGYLTGREVGSAVYDFAGKGHDYPEYLPPWHRLPSTLKRAALDAAFPADFSYGY